MVKNWMIYGATGYTGQLMVEEAVKKGLKPVVAGRSEAKLKPIAEQYGLEYCAFDLADSKAVEQEIAKVDLVLHCAGPFSQTAKPMMEACLSQKAHYIDITGEINVFEMCQAFDKHAKDADVVFCSGVGFDVIPTDCIAATLKQAFPEAVSLQLGFDSRSGLSPGTAKTSVEGLKEGGKVRQNGNITSVGFAHSVEKINFGDGEKLAMTIPWGDVSTAYHSTGIPNIKTYIPASPKLVKKMKRMNWFRPLLGLGFVQNFLKKQIDKRVRGPNKAKRDTLRTFVWGKAIDANGKSVTARVETASGYDVTVFGAVAIVEHFMQNDIAAGSATPSQIMGANFVERLEGSKSIEVS